MFVFEDLSFATNKDYSLQIGFIIVLATENNLDNDKGTVDLEGNIIHWSSVKCKQITRSVLASEFYAAVNGIDSGMTIKATIDQILEQISLSAIPLVLCTDSYSLYDYSTKIGTTTEKRLMIDVMALKQAYEQRKIAEVRWIDGKTNPADPMIKRSQCGALKYLVENNKLTINVVG